MIVTIDSDMLASLKGNRNSTWCPACNHTDKLILPFKEMGCGKCGGRRMFRVQEVEILISAGRIKIKASTGLMVGRK